MGIILSIIEISVNFNTIKKNKNYARKCSH